VSDDGGLGIGTVETQFTFRILGCQSWNLCDDNVDVEIELSDGNRYSATFFTLMNIQSLMKKNKLTGECAGGLYMWASNMILVENLCLETIERTIAGLIQEGELESACSQSNSEHRSGQLER
jgi:hypothetical protein